MKIIQINSVSTGSSTGRIAQQIGRVARSRGHDSLLASGGLNSEADSADYYIGTRADMLWHGLESLLADRHGLASRSATHRLVDWLQQENPDLVALHNLHGYFVNVPILFDYLKRRSIPVVWTFHDCWPFTGHCAFFDRFNCMKWQSECFDCPMTGYYPRSVVDRSRRNYRLKRQTYSELPNLTIVAPSDWMRRLVHKSFLAGKRTCVISNGVDLEVFGPADGRKHQTTVLGVASAWDARKGLDDFVKLRAALPNNYGIVLIGLNAAQRRNLPAGIEGIGKTNRIDELVGWYRRATVFANPTYSDNFPTTNIEALACGVPVVTYDTGGSPEAVDAITGRSVRRGDIAGLAAAVKELAQMDQTVMQERCRARAELLFNQSDRFGDYIDLYDSLVH